jgi:hypothetical protein
MLLAFRQIRLRSRHRNWRRQGSLQQCTTIQVRPDGKREGERRPDDGKNTESAKEAHLREV